MKRNRVPSYKSIVSLFVLFVAAVFGLLTRNHDVKAPITQPSQAVYHKPKSESVRPDARASLGTFGIQRVVDGDTIVLSNGEHVRLIGVDAPESSPNERAKRISARTQQDLETITTLGKASKAFLKTLLENKEVLVETDAGPRDRYGRLLAYVYLPVKNSVPKQYYVVQKNGQDYIFVNATLALAGYAAPLSVAPNVSYASLFQSLYNQARQEQNGLWQKKETSKVLALQ